MQSNLFAYRNFLIELFKSPEVNTRRHEDNLWVNRVRKYKFGKYITINLELVQKSSIKQQKGKI